MIVDTEESKKPQDDVLSSDEEEEKIQEDKEKFTATLTIGDAAKAGIKNLIVTPEGNAQALTKILFDGDRLTEIGKVEVEQKEKTKEVLKIFYVQQYQLLVLHPDGVKGAFCPSIISQLFARLAELGSPAPRILFLDSVYKTNYSTTDTGSLSLVDGELYPLKYYKSTAADPVLSGFLRKHQPAGVLNLIGGFSAALLIHAEMNGLSAACIHSIVDSHYVTAETLQSFAPVVLEVLQINDSKIEQVSRLPSFKTVLRDVNNRNNNIFN
jgi:hypothetical protein